MDCNSFPGDSVVKDPPAMQKCQRPRGSIPGLGRSPRGGNSNPFQYSCLGNPGERRGERREEPGRLYRLWNLKRAGHDLLTKQQQWIVIDVRILITSGDSDLGEAQNGISGLMKIIKMVKVTQNYTPAPSPTETNCSYLGFRRQLQRENQGLLRTS